MSGESSQRFARQRPDLRDFRIPVHGHTHPRNGGALDAEVGGGGGGGGIGSGAATSGDVSGGLPGPLTVVGIAGHAIDPGADSPGGFGFTRTVISPAQLVANTDNWNPTGLATADVIRLSTDASRNLTGIVAPGKPWSLLLENVGAFDLVIKHDVTSTAANRFLCPNDADVTLQKDSTVLIAYDLTSSRWRVMGGGGGGGGNATGQFIFGFDAGAFTLTPGKQQDIIAPFSGTITGWTLLANVSGSCVVDLWKQVYGSYPPTIANTIINTGAGGVKPTISGAIKAQSASVANWTTSVTAGDILRANLDSTVNFNRILLVVNYTRP